MKIITVMLLQLKGFFRKKTAWLLLIVLPLGFSYFAFGLFEGEAGGMSIPVVLVDEDQSSYSKMLIDLLKKEPYLEIQEKSLERGLQDLQENRVEGVYRIQQGFEERIRGDQIPELTAYTSSLAQGASAVGEIVISRSIRIISNARAANIIVSAEGEEGTGEEQEALWQKSFDKSESYWEPEPLMTLSLEEVLRGPAGGAEAERSGIFGAARLLTGPQGLVIIYSTLFSLWVFYKRREEEFSGLHKRQELMVGKTPLFIGKFSGDFLFLTLHHSVLILSIYLLQGKALRGDLIHHILILLMMQVLFIGLWTVLSKLSMGKEVLVVGLPIGILFTSMISGALWSRELLPGALQRLSWIFPQGIYLQGVEYSYLGETAAFYGVMAFGTGLGLILLWIGYWKESSREVT